MPGNDMRYAASKLVAARLARLAALVGIVASSVTAYCADPLQISAGPAFLGGHSSDGIAIDVENLGPDARGVVRITAGRGSTVYPIELPRGARKHFIGYPISGSSDYYEPIQCDLDTNRGTVHFEIQPTYGSQHVVALEISDDSGGLQFLKNNSTPQRRYNPDIPIYVKPEAAPGRLLAYRHLPAVVLGPGAERISDDAVHALIEYVVGGGRLFFNGGAVAATLHDPRWKAILPIANSHAVTKEVALHVGDEGFRNTLSVQEGIQMPGGTLAQGGVITTAYGLGEVIVLPFDLFGGLVKLWAGRPAYFTSLTAQPTGKTLIWPTLDPNNENPVYGRYGAISPAYSTVGGRPQKSDPFSFQPPPPESVGILIICYLLLVAPINFLILRKVKRSELAWFTTPIISVVFAVLILKLAAGLYFGKMMTAVSGSLVTAESGSSGIFRGSSQLFFPTGGSYDLQLSNVDWIGSTDPYDYGPRSPLSDDLTVVDVGQMVVPNMSVRNLQFKDMEFEQFVDTTGWFTILITRTAKSVKTTISNHSPYKLSAGTIFAEGGSAPILELAQGQSTTVEVPAIPIGRGQDQSVGGYGRQIHRAILQCALTGFRPGPQVGEEVSTRNHINLTLVGSASTEQGESR